jgi:hypothetical protein
MKQIIKTLFIAGVLVACSSIYAFELPRTEDKELQQIQEQDKFSAFNAEIYDLAYQTFIANKNLQDAFALAGQAVAQQPDSLLWRERLANVSLWLGYIDLAMQQWLVILAKTADPVVAQQAIATAKSVQDYQMLVKIYNLQLQHGVPMQHIWRDYSEALIIVGEPQRALDILEQQSKVQDVSDNLIALYKDMGQYNKALVILKQQRSKDGHSVANAMQQAVMLFSFNKLQEAYVEIKNVMPYAKADNKEYWTLLANLSWQNADEKIALVAYQNIYNSGGASQLEVGRLIYLLQRDNPAAALNLALASFDKSHTTETLVQATLLSFQLKRWNLFYNLYNKLAATEKDNNIQLLVEWALLDKNPTLASDFAAKAKRAGKILPAWLQLSLAMETNNTDAIADLLQNATDKKIDKSDQAAAANKLGYIKQAQQLAFEALYDNPNDSAKYQQFIDLALPATNSVTVMSQYENNATVSGLESFLRATYYVNPNFYVQPYFTIWFPTSNDPTEIQNIPNNITVYGAMFTQSVRRNIWSADLSYRQAMRNYARAILSWQRQVVAKWSTNISLGIREDADESSIMQIAASKNSIDLTNSYQLTARDLVTFVISGQQFNAQDNVFLGDGESFNFSVSHKFNFNYPDWNITFFTNANYYQRSGEQSMLIDSLFENTDQENTSISTTILPLGYYEVGFTGGFGQGFQQNYTKAIRPFAALSLFEHTRNGFEQVASCGLASAVIGRDHLYLYANFSHSQSDAGRINTIFGAEYRLYY